MITRRQLLKLAALAGAGLALPKGALPTGLSWAPRARASVQVAQVPLPGAAIAKYVDPLPHFANHRVDGTRPLTVTMKEFQQAVLPSTFAYPAPLTGTYVWGYEIGDGANTYGPLYPAYTIEARRGTPTTVTYVNSLGTDSAYPVLQQYLTVDQTLHWADPLGHHHHMPMMPYAGPAPAVPHLHGGEVPSVFDGGPDSWWTPGAEGTGPLPEDAYYRGSAYYTNVYQYPNAQQAATLWFHDHTLGATRLNVYAGLAGFYLLRDPQEAGLGLPGGDYEIEIAIQDRMFDSNGQWLFPDIGLNPTMHPFWLPEFLGDAIVVNGKTWPYLEVEPRRYRFRLLNGSNARFYSLRLMDPAAQLPGPPIWQIGTDGGLLDAPVQIAFPNELLLGPGERADVIVDFGALAPGTGPTFVLYNGARAPFLKGAPPDPNTTGQIMQFRVVRPLAGPDGSYNPATPGAMLRGGGSSLPAIVRLADPAAGAPAAGVYVDTRRQLTLNEVMGMGGPLEVLVNNSKWAAPASENPQVGATELWEIINLTADAHPIHLHLVQFQLLNRQAFQMNKYVKDYDAAFAGGAYVPAGGPPLPADTPNAAGALGGNPDVTPFLQGKPNPPNANEAGWKDTVVMYPGEVTRILVRFATQDAGVGAVGPGTNTYPFNPADGPGYVWHCHIVDHEDNEMMRPYQVRL